MTKREAYQAWLQFEIPVLRRIESVGFTVSEFVGAFVGACWAELLSVVAWTDKRPDDFSD